MDSMKDTKKVLRKGITKDMSDSEKKDKVVENFVNELNPHKDKINKIPKEVLFHILKGGNIN